MPGLSQLKKFSSDVLSLGDENTVRARRGERPVTVPIPKDVQDIDDSDEFVLGMPEGEELAEEEQIDEDLSDLAGLASDSGAGSGSGDGDAGSSFETPDMSNLLDPLGGDFGGDDMPDLSMFADEPVAEPEPEPEEIIEEEPEEVSVADMGLDDLLAGGGFDEPEEEAESFGLDDLSDDVGSAGGDGSEDGVFGLDDFGDLDNLENGGDGEVSDAGTSGDISDFGDFGDFGNSDGFGGGDVEDAEVISEGDGDQDGDNIAENGSLDDFFYQPFGDGDEKGDDLGSGDVLQGAGDELADADVVDADVVAEPEMGGEAAEGDVADDAVPESFSDDFSDNVLDSDLNNDFNMEPEVQGAEVSEPVADDVIEPEEGAGFEAEAGAEEEADAGNKEDEAPFDFGAEDIPDFSGDDIPNDIGASDNSDFDSASTDSIFDDDALPDMGDFSFGDDAGSEDTGSHDFELMSENDVKPENEFEDILESTKDSDDVEKSDAEPEVKAEAGAEEPSDSTDMSDNTEEDSGFSIDDLPDFGDSDFGDEDLGTSPFDDEQLDENPLDNSSDSPSDNLDSFDIPETSDTSSAEKEMPDMAEPALDSPFDNFSTDGLDDLPDMGSSSDFTAKDDIPDYGDFNLDDDNELKNGDNLDEPLETFDTSEMEGLDFDIPDTDTQLEGGDGAGGFDSDSEFEISGFSDVETVKDPNSKKSTLVTKSKTEKKKGKNPVISAITRDSDDEIDTEQDNLPPNTLSDKQYKTFLKNLSEYPLNVRLAFEELLVKDEFTDDAEFEVIEIILNKAPARQVASKLEKMLDVSIPVPRDYEHRSADEYEAYKKSLSYQLKNKIIPAILVGIVGILVCIGLFNFGKNCIYKPLKANSLYKQGYVLLQETEYPLSEIKFNEATTYRLSKKWFFNYARGYREHKQYQRAGKMYQNILYCFNHDKAAGLEYADMELNDLANYERAEEIVRREVLDYHINDADGILKLGDIFLEWGTEKDPAKLEEARAQYATLLQLYGQEDLYVSRMMRYFIRTDNLREVLQLKQHFEPREESLCADDWTELSGYLLDKYYGELSPAEEYLRYEIEGLRSLLLRAVESNPLNPIALYNLSRYFINTNETEHIESALQDTIEKFNDAKSLKNRDIYKYIDSYRLLGEYYVNREDFLQAQEQFAEGISLYITERDNAGFKGNAGVGKLYEDMGNLKYTVSGDYNEALLNYNHSVSLGNDNPSIRYRIGYVQYNNGDLTNALGSFMRAGDGIIKERNLLLAMANTLSLRGDDYAAEGYYGQLIERLDSEIASQGLILPQANAKDYDIVSTYLSASNNYGVTLYRLAKKTGDSGKNAEAIVQFMESARAWDALTRNPETLIRLDGSNLAEQNIKYITHPISEFEPAIYTNIPKTLLDNEKL